ncbi:hypothetical protein OIU77_007971 [Salix suchowensis]|uniref:Uncharacterized protein n=1 Tax=Salix suchowensis TaxID=1278906 RepID=A0ABQ9AJC4_9ROSI|nr:hypothetical protein OIU77_007971 [Salix suchowensis]
MSRSPSFVVKQELTLKTDLESLQQWVVAFCIIRFDLEQGQLIEECYPPGSLSNEEELDVAFSSFPDSVSQNQNRTSIHDCIFFFRIQRRKSSEQRNVNLLDIIETDDKEVSSNSTKEKVINRRKNRIDTKRLKYLYGYVFNRQRHDERLRRGKKTLEHIAAYVSTWPAPAPGKHMELPIGNALLKVSLPPAHSLPFEIGMFEESSSAMAPFLPNNHPAPNSNQVPFASRSAGRIPGRPEGFGLQKLSLKKFSPSSLLSAVKLIDAGMLPRVEESMATTPSEGSIPFIDPHPLPPFDADEFLANLSARVLHSNVVKFSMLVVEIRMVYIAVQEVPERAKLHAMVSKKAHNC